MGYEGGNTTLLARIGSGTQMDMINSNLTAFLFTAVLMVIHTSARQLSHEMFAPFIQLLSLPFNIHRALYFHREISVILPCI